MKELTINGGKELIFGGCSLRIKCGKDCFGGTSYFGYKDGRQYTDGYDYLPDLIEDYPEFEGFEDTCN